MTVFEKSIYVFLISILPVVELRGAVPVGAALGLPFYIYGPLAILGNLLPVPFILLFIPKILDLLERVRFLRPLIQWIRKKASRGLVKIQKHDTPPAVSDEEKAEITSAERGTTATTPTEKEVTSMEADDAGARITNAAGEDAESTTALPVATESENQTAQASTNFKKRKLSLGAFLGLMTFVLIPLPGTGAWTGALVASLFDFPKRNSALAITLGVLGACVIMTLASEGVVSIFRIFL